MALFRQLNDRQGLISSLASWSARGGSYICMTSVYSVSQLIECRRAGEEAIQLAHQLGWRPSARPIAAGDRFVEVVVATRFECYAMTKGM
jgi:hypothetical protein